MLASPLPLVAFMGLGAPEMMFVAMIALLLFGKDLPNVVREWGKTFNEFRRHLNSVKSELNEAIYAEPERPKLQYHSEFHSRDPLQQEIPAEGAGDLSASNGAAAASGETGAIGEAAAEADAARPLPSD
jgi:Sec-independent protein translocase protein TatA